MQIFHACPNRMDPITTHVMPEEVEKVEVIRGPFSVRYGQTMGGIMNIITEEPEQYEEFHLGGRIETGYESNGHGKYTHAGLLAADEQYDLLFSAGIRDYGNYQDGFGRDVYSGFQTYDYALKGGWHLPNHQRLQINWRHSFGKDILHAALPMDTEEENSQILSLDYVIRNLGPHLYSLTAKVFFSEVYHDMNNFRRPNFEKVEAESVVEAVTAGGKAELAFIPSARWLIYTGLDFRSLQRTGERERLVKADPITGETFPNPVLHRDAIWQDAVIDNAGLFVEARWYPSERISVSTGLRADFVTATLNDPAADFTEKYGEVGREEQWMFSGNATATWEFVENWDVQLSLGRGVRAPNMEERYINHFAIRSDGFEYVGDPHLEPEVNHQVELSLEKEGGRFHFLATAFYSHIENFITAAIDSTLPWKYQSPTSPQFARRFQNVHSASQFGLELSASYELLPHYYLFGMVAHVEAENHDWHESLSQVPPLTTVLGMRYDNGRLVANLKGRIVAIQEHIAPSFGETVTPGFETMDVSVEYRWDKLQVGVGLENIFDRNYYQHLNWSYRNLAESGILYEPGRNLSVFARYVFD